jgi:hypothetical protein
LMQTPPVETEKGVHDADRAISFALNENRLAFVEQLSRLASLPPTTVYRRLTQSLDSKARHHRWVLHGLSGAQSADRVSLSQRLLETLEVHRHRAWHGIVTLNESRFCLSTGHESICLPNALPPLGQQSWPIWTACLPSRGVNRLSRKHRSTAFQHQFPLFSIQFPGVSYVQSAAKLFDFIALFTHFLRAMSSWVEWNCR